ncbi:chemotaxis protein methyltransferase [Paenibacillus macerans]|nr:chemotaxis protein methyltransferase [Paenibacillus macerans]
MKRRLTTLRNKNGFSSFADFYAAMMGNKALFYEFLDKMTINVSEFWRNPNRWEVLRDKVLPELAKDGSKLRVWSAACSTGEEPYTLTMILADLGLLPRTYLLASDIDDGALAKAQEGMYLERSLKDVPKDVAQRYFAPDGAMYRFDAKLKKAVTFKKQNLLLDRFEEGFDLIVCRNVMIYFTEEAKQGLYHKFSEALARAAFCSSAARSRFFRRANTVWKRPKRFFTGNKLRFLKPSRLSRGFEGRSRCFRSAFFKTL